MTFFSNFSKAPVADGSPCPAMRTLVSQLSDGSLHGIRLWFAERHTRHCIRCAGALISLVDLETRLQAHGITERQQKDAATGSRTKSDSFPQSLRVQISDALDRVDASPIG